MARENNGILLKFERLVALRGIDSLGLQDLGGRAKPAIPEAPRPCAYRIIRWGLGARATGPIGSIGLYRIFRWDLGAGTTEHPTVVWSFWAS